MVICGGLCIGAAVVAAGGAGYALSGNSGSVATNSTDIMLEAIQKTTNQVSQQCVQSAQNIAYAEYAQDPACAEFGSPAKIEVTASNKARVRDIKCTFESIFDAKNEQTMAATLDQAAKSVSEGIGGAKAEASNMASVTARALQETRNEVMSACKQQVLNDARASAVGCTANGGEVYIRAENDAIAEGMECAHSSISSMDSTQKVEAEVKQVADAYSKGMDPAMLFVAIILVLLFVVFSFGKILNTVTETATQTFMKLFALIGPILIGLGIYYYFAWSKEADPQTISYSRGLRGDPCKADDEEVQQFASYAEMLKAFEEKTEFVAFDYIAYKVEKDANGHDIPVKLPSPQYIFYKSACNRKDIGQGELLDDVRTMEKPKIYDDEGNPKRDIEGTWPSKHWDVAEDGRANTSGWRVGPALSDKHKGYVGAMIGGGLLVIIFSMMQMGGKKSTPTPAATGSAAPPAIPAV